MRNIIIGSHFNLLWIDYDKTKVGWRVMVEHGHDKRICHDRLTRTSSTCNQKVRHLGKIANDDFT